MPEPRQGDSRKLVAIVFIDMVGYSAAMQESEADAQGAVSTLWSLVRPAAAQSGGEEIRTFGDGMLLTFPGVVAAVQTCLQVFDALALRNRGTTDKQRIRARAGIHLGDIGIDGSEIYGEGVNLAARLVNLAPAGGITISPHVRDQIRSALDHPMKSLGIKVLKNIKSPMEVLCLVGPDCTPEELEDAANRGNSPLPRLRFGAAVFDERTQELTVSGTVAKIDHRGIAVLRALLHHAGETVTKRELREAAGAITDAALARRISKLREVLRDADHSKIKTQTGLGYRLTVPVTVEAEPNIALTQFDFRPGDHPPMRPLWKLEEMLGQGGQGEVWLARHCKTGEQRVYKFGLDPAKLSSLKREITISRLLQSAPRCEHFIRVLDWNLELSPYFIECEYGGSRDLAAWMESQGGVGHVPLTRRLELVAQVADALASAHSIGVLHKDLKPRNVLVNQPHGEDPQVKLADFGSGGVLDKQNLEDAGITDMGFTHSVVLESGSTRGTPMYYAPELLSGQPLTLQADIYALGVMLYQFIVGDLRKPLSAGWEADIEDELLREDIAEAVAGDPLRRLADASSLAERLRTLRLRHKKREEERAERLRIEQERQRDRAKVREAELRLERMEARRTWMLSTVAVICIGFGVSILLYFQAKRAQQEAEVAARTSQAVAEFLSRDLFSQVGEKPLRNLTIREMLAAAASTVASREDLTPRATARIHAALGSAFLSIDELDGARRHLGESLQIYEDMGLLGTAQSVAIASKLLHAKSAKSFLNSDQDLAQFERILEASVEVLGRGHSAVLDLRFAVANARRSSGDYAGAVNAFRDLLDDARSTAVPHWPQINTTEQALGFCLIVLGAFDESAQLMRTLVGRLDKQQALPSTKNSGPYSSGINLAVAKMLLARALVELEDFAEADSQLDSAKDLLELWAIDEHHSASLSYGMVQGILAMRQQDWGEAIQILEANLQRTLEAPWNSTGDGAWLVQRWLAKAYLAANRPEDALRMISQSLERGLRLSPPEDIRMHAIRVDLAEIMVANGRLGDAARALQDVIIADVTQQAKHHPVLAARNRVDAMIAMRQGRAIESRRLFQEALRIYENRYGANHGLTQRARAESSAIVPRPKSQEP